eukprot:CAMPEP_0203812842 /NCGR_PEP_ID=MMETSP0115-20131106/4377_1 /ASSEMBLY_ACC=CAM_ASM_000227 /TAXON_ID=33651 /ORGANISM="Bicosoecid sp, Strain ms1" /LENGTH=313 /DNA_ID=CAMNT_0050721693 /DNA_START=40 /DNA_END=979 /DNA_ORIENTATION=-
MRWGPLLEYVLAAQLVLSLFAQLAATPSWNLALVFWGFYSYHSKNARALLIFMAVTALTIVLDVTWCGIWGSYIHDMIAIASSTQGSTENFALAMVILNMFAKFPALFFARGLFLQNGGVWSVSQPAPGMPAEDAFIGTSIGSMGGGAGDAGGHAGAHTANPVAVDAYGGGGYAAPAEPTAGHDAGGYAGTRAAAAAALTSECVRGCVGGGAPRVGVVVASGGGGGARRVSSTAATTSARLHSAKRARAQHHAHTRSHAQPPSAASLRRARRCGRRRRRRRRRRCPRLAQEPRDARRHLLAAVLLQEMPRALH